jgi:hypothetical protein
MRFAVVFLVACSAAPAPTKPTPVAPPADGAFAPLSPLLGSWQGTDPDRHSTGSFTLAPDLGGKVLVRHNTNDSPQGHHEDLMVVHSTPAGLRASYFDNEGHTIHYAVARTDDRIEMLSDEVAGQPRFKLVYTVKGADELVIDFAMAMPGADFQHYTGGTVHRVH